MRRGVRRLVAFAALLRSAASKHAASKHAVATLLTTQPSAKTDGWSPRSVKAARRNTETCASGTALCAILVLAATIRERAGRAGN